MDEATLQALLEYATRELNKEGIGKKRRTRLENIAENTTALLLEKERARPPRASAARPGAPSTSGPGGSGPPPNGAYTYQSDMLQLGILIERAVKDSSLHLPREAKRLLLQLKSKRPDERPTAEDVLRSKWIGCSARGCKALDTTCATAKGRPLVKQRLEKRRGEQDRTKKKRGSAASAARGEQERGKKKRGSAASAARAEQKRGKKKRGKKKRGTAASAAPSAHAAALQQQSSRGGPSRKRSRQAEQQSAPKRRRA